MFEFVVYALIGCVAGIISGILGIGGALFIIPVLTAVLKYKHKTAQGTSIAIMIPPISLLGALEYYQAGHVHLLAAVCIVLGFIPSDHFGAKVANRLNTRILKRIFASFLIGISIILFFKII